MSAILKTMCWVSTTRSVILAIRSYEPHRTSQILFLGEEVLSARLASSRQARAWIRGSGIRSAVQYVTPHQFPGLRRIYMFEPLSVVSLQRTCQVMGGGRGYDALTLLPLHLHRFYPRTVVSSAKVKRYRCTLTVGQWLLKD